MGATLFSLSTQLSSSVEAEIFQLFHQFAEIQIYFCHECTWHENAFKLVQIILVYVWFNRSRFKSIYCPFNAISIKVLTYKVLMIQKIMKNNRCNILYKRNLWKSTLLNVERVTHVERVTQRPRSNKLLQRDREQKCSIKENKIEEELNMSLQSRHMKIINTNDLQIIYHDHDQGTLFCAFCSHHCHWGGFCNPKRFSTIRVLCPVPLYPC